MSSPSPHLALGASIKVAIEKAVTSSNLDELDQLNPPLPPRILARLLLDYVPESTEPEVYAGKVVGLLNSPVLEGDDGRIQVGILEFTAFNGTVGDWALQRAKAIDNATGDLSLISTMLMTFSNLTEDFTIQKYLNGPFASLEILVYEFQGDWMLEELEGSNRKEAITKVLEETDVETALERILPGILDDDRELWGVVWRWMKDRGWGSVSPVLRDWAGPPGELKRDYVRTGLEIAYEGKDIENEVWDVYEILRAVGGSFASIMEIALPPDVIGSSNPEEETKEMFFDATPFALKAFFTLVTAAEQLGISLGQALDYRVEASREKQEFRFESLLKGVNWSGKSEAEVESHVVDARRLRDYAKVFGRIERSNFDERMFKTLLKAHKYSVARKLFIIQGEPSLSPERIQELVIENFYTNYDSASNGNKTRGKMKAAAYALELLDFVRNPSDSILRARELLNATHSLSQFSLTLHPNTPFTPRELRHHPNPTDLISHVLAQNPTLYAQPDALIPIFTSLLFGITGKVPTNIDLASIILQQAILTALSVDDFQTAYSLIQTRAMPSSPDDILRPVEDANSTLWTAILQAARHLPAADPSLDSQELKMRMELAAVSLATAPQDALVEIVGVWRRLEEKLITAEAEERDSERNAVGGYNQRGAGMKAGAAGMGPGMMSQAQQAQEARRKRDIVSSAVTSGLASGLGWVLGAQPVRR